MYNSNTVIVFSTLLYLSCLYDAAVSKFWMHQKVEINQMSVRLFWDFWLDVMMTKKISISDIIEISAFFPGCYTAYKINSICTMHKLCLLITVNILLNVKHK